MKIGTVILAAGNSSRMNGGVKQLLSFRGKSMLRCAVDAAFGSQCCPVVLILGANAEQLIPETEGLPVLVEFNEDWSKGISSSIKVGLQKLLRLEPTLDATI